MIESAPRCASRLRVLACCHPAGHDGHHEFPASDGNRTGWIETAAGGVVEFAIRDESWLARVRGTMPRQLPETLPAGTRTVYGDVAIGEVKQRDAGYIVDGKYFHACAIAWATTTPIQEAKAPCECEGVSLVRGACGKCGRPARPAPCPASDDDGAPDVAGLHAGADNGALETVTCRECSKPERPVLATHAGLCVYCDSRNEAHPPLTLAQKLNEAGARHRNEAALAAETLRPSNARRELAKPHPWEQF